MERMEELLLQSPAKVNLRLEILKKREDGYHELRTIFQKINLQDTLLFSLERRKGISISTDHPHLPLGRRNLIDRAARSILKRSNYPGGVRIKIEKRIPIGAGLGGGSSNAATTLKALNHLLDMGFSKKELMEIGLEIGADVPFFFMEGAAIGLGIGERLNKITLPDLWFVLIHPNFEVSTHWAYQHFVLTRSTSQTPSSEERTEKHRSGSTLSLLEPLGTGAEGLTKKEFHINLHRFINTPKKISRLLRNDLEEVVSREYPQINTMKKILLSVGALGALMTGSGPTVFGVFSEEGNASEATINVKKMVRRKEWTVLNARSLPV